MPASDKLLNYLGSERIRYEKDCMLSEHSSFRIGGPADLALFPDGKQISGLINELESENTRYIVIGNGSNVLFSDNGYRGAVIFTGGMDHVSIDGCAISAEAGCSLTGLAVYARNHSLTGLEFAYGIPGSVGGAVYMNAGAYGGEMSDVVVSSICYEPGYGLRTVTGGDHSFAYRHSCYSDSVRVILSAKIVLKLGDPDEIKDKMKDLMNRRREKQPLDLPSAGSAFKRYPGYFTAALIDEAGLKGYSIGGAAVSEKHAGFIVNKGGATASDVLELIKVIRSRIFDIHGILIEPEIKYIEE